MSTHWYPETLAAQALGEEDSSTGELVAPIHVATTFARRDDYSLPAGRSYIRDLGATQEQVEQLLCSLEGGFEALCFASGMAACTAPFHALAQGDHVLVSDTIYHGVLSWLTAFAEARGLSYDLFPAGNSDAFAAMIRPGETRMVWLETPANPVWTVTDIAAIADIAHGHGVFVAVDSTCATPVLTRPIDFGADLVCHSATKYLNGHSDVLAGMLVAARDSDFWQRIRQHRLLAGSVLGSMEAWLLMRGMRTLYLRVRQQSASALELAQWLESRDNVEKVHYPGLPGDPGHAVACRQMAGGFGGMLSFLVPGGREEAIAVACRARVFKRATSLGGVESLLEHRKTSESDITGTPDNLIRVSVGIERVEDLVDDFAHMLAG
jgi:cystathionine gamma-synthase